ncbi:MAG: hypothetical protein HC927_09770 [Deltaproteobacteria bacterium]|nr:hypothetical protein [Deltaproteobacteria bacterium]
MQEDAEARERRAREHRASWVIEALSDKPPAVPVSLAERLEVMEQLRRIGCALAGIEYREGATPKEERQRWPVERIG